LLSTDLFSTDLRIPISLFDFSDGKLVIISQTPGVTMLHIWNLGINIHLGNSTVDGIKLIDGKIYVKGYYNQILPFFKIFEVKNGEEIITINHKDAFCNLFICTKER
jgi:hypothetical protein